VSRFSRYRTSRVVFSDRACAGSSKFEAVIRSRGIALGSLLALGLLVTFLLAAAFVRDVLAMTIRSNAFVF
jgi:uncharacterized membrane protein